MKPMVCGAVLYNPYGTDIEVAGGKGVNDQLAVSFVHEYIKTIKMISCMTNCRDITNH